MIECGFFNSVNGDRKYSAEMMNRPYELLVSNGVFATPEGTPSNYLQVMANDDNDMTVVVKTGRGIFKDKWLINDSDILLDIDRSEVTLTRSDSIIVRVDTSETVRMGTIGVKKGTPSSNPVAPVMARSEDVYEYRLADVTVTPQASTIQQLNIRDQRGSKDCPWVTSLIQQVDTSTLMIQWEDAYNKYFDQNKARFDTYHTENSERFDGYFNEINATFDEFMVSNKGKFDTYYASIQTQFANYYNEQVTRFNKQYGDNQSEFDKLFAKMKDDVASLIMTVQSGYYETKTANETTVTVGVDYDTLIVYINGLHAIMGKDYTLSGKTITLTSSVAAGTVISYVAYKQGSA